MKSVGFVMNFSMVNTVALVCLCACAYTAGEELKRRLCGRHLANVLEFTCAERGFHVRKRAGRSLGSVFVKRQPSKYQTPTPKDVKTISDNDQMLLPRNGTVSVKVQEIGTDSDMGKFLGTILSRADGGNSQNIANENISEEEVQRRRRSVRSNVVEECCLRPCSITTLTSYCAAPEDPEEEIPLEQLRQIFMLPNRTHSPFTSGTGQPIRRITSPRPSAQINRGNRNRSDYFWVSLGGNLATRSPLLEK